MKTHTSLLLLIGTLQASIKYLDDCLDIEVNKKPLFTMDLKSAAKTLLTKLECWFKRYYNEKIEDTDAVSNQVDCLVEIYERSAQIIFQINEKGEVIKSEFNTELESLLNKYEINILTI